MPEKKSKHEQLSPGQQKIQEYIARIQAGESKEEITKGLSRSFVAGIEAGLQSPESPESQQDDLSENAESAQVPPQYRGLDAETLDILWTIPEYLDPKKSKAEQEKKAKLLEGLRQYESQVKKDHLEVEELRKGLGLESKQEKGADLAEADILPLEERKKLIGWPASYELAKIAKKQGIDLSKLSREEYVDFAIENDCPIGDTQLRAAPWQRMGTSPKEIMEMNKKLSKEFPKEVDKEFHKFSENIKEIAEKDNRNIEEGIRVRSGTKDSNSWLFFAINEGADRKSRETFKSYIALQNLEKLTPQRFQGFLNALRDANYQGDVKIFQDMKMMGMRLNDQIVMHGRSEQDAKLGLQIAEQFFTEELSQKSFGKDEVVDGKELSYSQILENRIKDSIRQK